MKRGAAVVLAVVAFPFVMAGVVVAAVVTGLWMAAVDVFVPERP